MQAIFIRSLILGLAVAVATCAVTPEISPVKFQKRLAGPGAYRFARADAARIKSMAQRVSWAAEEIDRIHREFRTLSRVGASRSDLLELKFGLQQWRLAGKDRLLELCLATPSAGAYRSALRGLVGLAPVLSERDLVALGHKALTFPGQGELMADFTRLLALQGDARKTRSVLGALPRDPGLEIVDHADGPAVIPDIPASRASDWPWTRVLANPVLGHYRRDQQGRVRFRGISFCPGDLLLVNLTNPSEGLFTSFAREENYSYHLGLYVELERDGVRIPCVYESYEHGTRVVPLVTYLNPAHTLYVEVLRWRNRPSGSARALGAAVLDALGRPHGFNIYIDEARSDNGHYITCTSAITRILERAGFPVPAEQSEICPATCHNLHRLGLGVNEFLTPTDFLQMEELEVAGWIDNQNWSRLLAAALANHYLHRQFRTRLLDPWSDQAFRFYLFGARVILDDAPLLGGLLRSVFGFNAQNFPAGPAAALAFVLRVEEEMDGAVCDIEDALEHNDAFYQEATWFSVHTALSDPQLSRLVASRFPAMRIWFRRPGPHARDNRFAGHWPPAWP